MITFVAPATSAYFASNTTFTVDRNPVRSKEVRMISNSVPYAVLEQSRADGINPVTETFEFKLTNLPLATAEALDGYFTELKSSEAITFTFPNSVIKKYRIVTWALEAFSSKFVNLVVQCEEAFL